MENNKGKKACSEPYRENGDGLEFNESDGYIFDMSEWKSQIIKLINSHQNEVSHEKSMNNIMSKEYSIYGKKISLRNESNINSLIIYIKIKLNICYKMSIRWNTIYLII